MKHMSFTTLLQMLREGKEDFGLLGGGSNIDPNESSVIVKPHDPRNYSLYGSEVV
ncbi:MAG: hypothetical protein ACLUOI_29565 [Eisenbergiella sp.]